MNIKETEKVINEVKKNRQPFKILRFRKSERRVHWAIAIPFMVCFATALVLVLFYNPYPLRPYRSVFSWIHRISGFCLIIFPMFSIVKSRHDYKIYFNNIKQAWIWTMEDIKWLALMGLAAISSRFKLPEQGKFNAAEKINFMTLMSTYPLYILTGSFIWLTDGALLSWLVHFGMALIATPLLLGHLYMAMINPKSRVGLSGMVTGFVDRKWAKHHYARWYRENFENNTSLIDIQKNTILLTGDNSLPACYAAVHLMESFRAGQKNFNRKSEKVIPVLSRYLQKPGCPQNFVAADMNCFLSSRKQEAT